MASQNRSRLLRSHSNPTNTTTRIASDSSPPTSRSLSTDDYLELWVCDQGLKSRVLGNLALVGWIEIDGKAQGVQSIRPMAPEQFGRRQHHPRLIILGRPVSSGDGGLASAFDYTAMPSSSEFGSRATIEKRVFRLRLANNHGGRPQRRGDRECNSEPLQR
jgi:hypothetical protein